MQPGPAFVECDVNKTVVTGKLPSLHLYKIVIFNYIDKIVNRTHVSMVQATKTFRCIRGEDLC